MVNIVLKILLLISPVAYISTMRPEKFEIIFFHLGVIALFLASLFDTVKREVKLPYSIIGLLALLVINVLLHSFQLASVGILLNVFMFFIGFDILLKYMGEPKQFYKYIAIAASVSVLIWITQRYFIDILPIKPEIKELGGGIFGTITRLSNYVTISSPIIFSVCPIFAVIVLALSIFGTQSLPVIILFITAFLLSSKTKRIFITLLLVGFLSLFFNSIVSHVATSVNVRLFTVLPGVLSGIFSTPLIGNGLGSYYSKFGNDSFNIFILLWHDLGLIGLSLFCYVLFSIKNAIKIDIQSLSIIAVMLTASLDYVIEIPRLWFTLMFILASFFITRKIERRDYKCLLNS